MTATVNKSTALQFMEYAFTYNVEAAMALFHEDAIWWVSGRSERLSVSGEYNLPRIRKLLQGLGKTFPQGLDMTFHGVTAEDNRVAIEVESSGKCITGNHYQNRYHFLLQFQDGKIIRLHEYMDTLHLLETLDV